MNDETLANILNISRRMAETRVLTPLLNYVIDEAISLVGAERGFVVLLQSDGSFETRVKRGQGGEELEPGEDQISRSVLKQVIESEKPLILRDAVNNPDFNVAQSVMALKLRSIMCVPLISRGEILGAIYVENRAIRNRFKEEDLPPLILFAHQAAVAIENASMNENLEKAYKALEKLDKTKSDFIDIAAHELRTPLTIIKGYVHLLAKKMRGDSEASHLLAGIASGQERIHEVINSMLDIAKIDSDVLNVVKRPIQLDQLIRKVVSDFTGAIEEREHTVLISDLDTLPAIQADGQLLYKVFHHIINNAIKYTPNGGRITVTGHLIQNRAVPEVEIVISDTGIGIDPENHELIFEKFYQTGKVAFHSSSKTKFKGGGPGLGLAITRGIVLAHQGRAWAESTEYNEETCPGSDFHVVLPLQ